MDVLSLLFKVMLRLCLIIVNRFLIYEILSNDSY
jgi:hypothetical protein